jgi:hypothetical protein
LYLHSIIVIVINNGDIKHWLEAQKKIFEVKNRLDEDPSILDEFNPIFIFALNHQKIILPSEYLYLLDEDNIFAVSQVWVWILTEFYMNSWDKKSPNGTIIALNWCLENKFPMTHDRCILTKKAKEVRCDLFKSWITFVMAKYEILFQQNISLLKDIFKLAGRLFRISWHEYDIYENSVDLMIGKL